VITHRRLAELAEQVRSHRGPVRLVGIDGCAGAGKTTFAAALSRELDDASVIHTDDFASHDQPLEWWPRMLHRVVEPLLRDQPASYQPYDWVNRRLSADVITVEPQDVVLIEGVGATRAVWRDRLALRIWIDCPRDIRLARGIARDGEDLRQFWLDWMTAEDDYVATEQPQLHADVIVSGANGAPGGA
jgi:uridine kinase